MVDTPTRLGTRAVAVLGAAVGIVIQYAPPFRWATGPRSRWIEPLRARMSQLLGAAFDDRAGPRSVTEAEYAGTLGGSLEEVETLLWNRGFRRNPLSRLKTRDGDPEVGSWVYRPRPLAERQLHLILFRTQAGRDAVDVYAHAEPSSVNPFVAAAHFDAAGQNVAEGVERTRNRLPLDVVRETPDPPEGPWSAA
ncbi:hypothetical protein [Halorubrum sp. BV1]|uniref:hypothetical protein n=1 Tax=Halorubrum sp. BV1 TaxID=1498500 RepID=UPI0006798409|nr:hypothetical protein [Halorubrum sp. BV1]